MFWNREPGDENMVGLSIFVYFVTASTEEASESTRFLVAEKQKKRTKRKIKKRGTFYVR
jgi:hypothetical protein